MYFDFQALVFLISSFYIGEVDGFERDSRRVEKFSVCLVAAKAEMYQAWFLINGRVLCFLNESQF